MSNRTRSCLIFSFLTVFITLSACFKQQTPVEKIYHVLENVVSAEKVFEEQQDPLVDLEIKEKSVYDKMIGLGMKQYDEIVKLSNEALSMVNQRQEYMDKETDSIKESEKEFQKMADLKEELDDKELKKQANDLYTVMMKRYKAHAELYKEYTKGTTYDKQLYEMFKDKNLTMDQLESQINKLNDTYKKIYAANESFNKLTEQYNSKKYIFYQKAGLKTK